MPAGFLTVTLALALILPTATEQAPVDPETAATVKTFAEAFLAQDVTRMKEHFADRVNFGGGLRLLGTPHRGEGELTRDTLVNAYTKLFADVGRERWQELVVKPARPNLSQPTRNGELFGRSRIIFVFRRVDGTLRIVGHYADYYPWLHS
jgi:hypothetical protein